MITPADAIQRAVEDLDAAEKASSPDAATALVRAAEGWGQLAALVASLIPQPTAPPAPPTLDLPPCPQCGAPLRIVPLVLRVAEAEIRRVRVVCTANDDHDTAQVVAR